MCQRYRLFLFTSTIVKPLAWFPFAFSFRMFFKYWIKIGCAKLFDFIGEFACSNWFSIIRSLLHTWRAAIEKSKQQTKRKHWGSMCMKRTSKILCAKKTVRNANVSRPTEEYIDINYSRLTTPVFSHFQISIPNPQSCIVIAPLTSSEWWKSVTDICSHPWNGIGCMAKTIIIAQVWCKLLRIFQKANLNFYTQFKVSNFESAACINREKWLLLFFPLFRIELRFRYVGYDKKSNAMYIKTNIRIFLNSKFDFRFATKNRTKPIVNINRIEWWKLINSEKQFYWKFEKQHHYIWLLCNESHKTCKIVLQTNFLSQSIAICSNSIVTFKFD